MVVGTEVHAGYLPWGDAWDIVLGRTNRPPTREEWERATLHRGWSVLFGDGAGAMVVERADAPGFGVLGSVLHTDGSHCELIVGGDFGFVHRPYISEAMLVEGLHLPRMDGSGLYRQAVQLIPQAIGEVLEKSRFSVGDLDVVVTHQANERILEGVRRRLGVDEQLVPSNIARWGNTTAATLPILFHELRQRGPERSGVARVLLSFWSGCPLGCPLVPGADGDMTGWIAFASSDYRRQ